MAVKSTGFEIQKRMCATCIYRPDSTLDINALEAQVADRYGGFDGYRVCHHSKNACCRGFWDRHKDKFALGQIAQRLGFVRFVEHDTLHKKGANSPNRRLQMNMHIHSGDDRCQNDIDLVFRQNKKAR